MNSFKENIKKCSLEDLYSTYADEIFIYWWKNESV